MLKLLTDCDKCMYKRVCKWDTMTDHEHVNVSFSCPDYQEQKPTPKGFA